MAYEIKTQNGEVFQHKGSPVFGFDMINTVVAKKVNIDARLMDMIGSTEQKDRDGDVLTTSGWILEDFLKNPVFLWAHDYAGVPLAAVGSVIKKNKPEPHLYFKDIRYPRKGLFPFADMILELYGEKIINASSVGFLPYEWEDMEQKDGDTPSHFKGRKYNKQLLLELSGCAVPSNPGALQNQLDVYAQKSFGGVPGEELTKYVMKGNILVPDKADDILEDLNIKALEIIDETESKVYQVPKQIEKSYRQKVKEETDIQNFEYLLHHVTSDEEGNESLHHCYVYDHIGNMFIQGHMVVRDGKIFLDGKKVKNGTYHVLKGLEPTQDVAWGDDQAEEQNIKPKKMTAGMKFSAKSKEW